MAKGALHEAEQTLNDDKNVGTNNIGLDPHTTTTIPTTTSNLSEQTDVTKYSDQSVNHGGKQRLSNTIDTYDEPRMHIKYQLAQEAETQIDRAWKGLDNKFGNNVTKMEAADNLKPKSDSSPSTSDASQLSSSLRSLHLGRTDSNSKIDNLATENQLHHTSTSHSGKSDVHSASSPIISQDSHSGQENRSKSRCGAKPGSNRRKYSYFGWD